MEKIVLSGRVLINEGISQKIYDKININKNEIEKLNCSDTFKLIKMDLDSLSPLKK